MNFWHRRLGWMVYGMVAVGLIVLAAVAVERLAAEEAPRDHSASHARTDNAPTKPSESAERVAAEILQIRESIGSAWRGEPIEESSHPAASTADAEVIRTALLSQAQSAATAPQILPPQSPQTLQETLRESAYQLDLVAHTLECQELYPQADKLRAMATEFRNQARVHSPPQPSKQGRFAAPAPPAATD